MHFVKAKGLLSANNGMNIYRGCTHGCIYCDSRSTCYNMTHAFEDVEVKENAPELLEKALRSKRSKCMIGTGSMSDPYMPAEKELCLTRKCLELIDRYGFGATVITKSDLVLRDLDLLKSINSKGKAVVQMTLTTYDDGLCGVLEPNVCVTSRRFEVLKILRDNGIPTVVWLSPFLPYINDTAANLNGLLGYCRDAKVKGIIFFGVGLTLREGNREYYYQKLDCHFPGLKARYVKEYGDSYGIISRRNKELSRLVTDFCAENGILYGTEAVFSYLSELPSPYEQLSLFDMTNPKR